MTCDLPKSVCHTLYFQKPEYRPMQRCTIFAQCQTRPQKTLPTPDLGPFWKTAGIVLLVNVIAVKFWPKCIFLCLIRAFSLNYLVFAFKMDFVVTHLWFLTVGISSFNVLYCCLMRKLHTALRAVLCCWNMRGFFYISSLWRNVKPCVNLCSLNS